MNFKSIAKTNLLFGSLIISLGLQALPATAQAVTDAQVSALVEALRQAAPPQAANDGMYSQWQVLPGNISRWAKFCTKQDLTPQQFEADATKAKSIVTCIVGDLLRDEYKASSNNELTAVRRAACWWMTGESAACKSGATATYADKVVSVYQQQQPKK
ncbi:hypothetical protein [Microcoleus vaginatus]|uniref:hypothetical protein n=1 Tax=Microcoleus vaginatus TaxID=119532 RepID=UPI0016835EF1|nr:hypothetical protein [Microcoleus sp. FACHB-84]MBD2009827.1 hypothetical protein [Microcoleus sp. FACHB-45]